MSIIILFNLNQFSFNFQCHAIIQQRLYNAVIKVPRHLRIKWSLLKQEAPLNDNGYLLLLSNRIKNNTCYFFVADLYPDMVLTGSS